MHMEISLAEEFPIFIFVFVFAHVYAPSSDCVGPLEIVGGNTWEAKEERQAGA